MGNHKFRLSDMMPNAWFYKLKDMGKPRNHAAASSKKKPPLQHQPEFTSHRQSYYFTSEPFNKSEKLYNSPINPKSSDVHFPDPPRKSPRRKSTRRKSARSSINKVNSLSSTKLVTSSSSVSAGCGCKAIVDSDSTLDYSPSPPDSTSPDRDVESDADVVASWSTSSCSCRVSSSATEIIIDVDTRKSKFDDFEQLELPPILTKPAKFSEMVSEIKNRDTAPPVNYRRSVINTATTEHYHLSVKEKKPSPQIRRITPNTPGLKLRSNSPKIASKKIQAYGRKTISSSARKNNLSDSFAVIKSSQDPQRDFRESMVEMIMENNIRASKDLEELLACYLSLNSNEYHDIIVKVFEQIWFDLTDIQL